MDLISPFVDGSLPRLEELLSIGLLAVQVLMDIIMILPICVRFHFVFFGIEESFGLNIITFWALEELSKYSSLIAKIPGIPIRRTKGRLNA